MRKALMLFVICVSFSLSAQNLLDKKITVKFLNESLLECVNKIEKVSQVNFSYNLNVLQSEKVIVSQEFNSQTLNTILQNILKKTSIKYKQIGNQITLYKSTSNKQIVSLSGYVINAQSHEKVIGAKVFFKALGQGCITNAYGYYQINLPKGKYVYLVQSLGMKTTLDTLTLNSDLIFNIKIQEAKIELKTIEVSALRKDSLTIVTNEIANLNKVTINNTEIKQLPTSNGVADVTRNIQQQAGVQPALDGSSAYMVRGVSSGNNLILLDEIPIYHPNHLLGIYSIINASAIKSTSFFKDYIPAKFGTRNSSVLNIYTKEGDMQKYNLTIGLGASIPHIDIDGPIIKDKMAFFVSIRKSSNALQGLNLPTQTNLPKPNFYDVTLKLNYIQSHKNRFYLTSYFGQDDIDNQTTKYKWGNKSVAFRWNNIINDKTFANLTIVYNTFNYKITSTFLDNDSINQQVKANQIKYNVTKYISNKQKLNFGLSVLNTRTKSNGNNFGGFFLNRNAIETAVYATYKKSQQPKINYQFGVRLPFNFHIGTNDSAYFLKQDLSYLPIYYTKNKLYDLKLSIDPRFLWSYQINKKNKFQFATIINTQFTHVVKYNTNIFPVEIWTTSSKYLKPERNFQVSFGLMHTEKYFKNSITLFARHITNVLDYAQTTFTGKNLGFESNLLSGKLNMFGAEFTTQFKLNAKYNGAFSYTYNYGRQKINGINNNLPYKPHYYRPHFLALNQYYVLSNKWEFGANFILHSKTSITLPTGKFTIDNVEYPFYDGTKNTSYLPTYHRLDLSIKRTLGIKKQKNRGYLKFIIVNIYGRSNVSNAFVGINDLNPNKIDIKQQNFTPFNVYITYFIKI